MNKLLEARLFSVSSGSSRWLVVAKSKEDAERFLQERGQDISSKMCYTEFVARIDYITPDIYDEEFELRSAREEEVLWTSQTDVLT